MKRNLSQTAVHAVLTLLTVFVMIDFTVDIAVRGNENKNKAVFFLYDPQAAYL